MATEVDGRAAKLSSMVTQRDEWVLGKGSKSGRWSSTSIHKAVPIVSRAITKSSRAVPTDEVWEERKEG